MTSPLKELQTEGEIDNLSRELPHNCNGLSLLIFTVAFALVGCSALLQHFEETALSNSESATSTPVLKNCTPTFSDEPSPTYRPNTPVRTVVGSGHVITGVVLSSRDCQPIANAMLEFWPEEAGIGHPSTSRATFFTDKNGHYRFECNLPEHIHMRISAEGYRTIFNNSYHPEGAPEGVFNIVLRPD